MTLTSFRSEQDVRSATAPGDDTRPTSVSPIDPYPFELSLDEVWIPRAGMWAVMSAIFGILVLVALSGFSDEGLPGADAIVIGVFVYGAVVALLSLFVFLEINIRKVRKPGYLIILMGIFGIGALMTLAQMLMGNGGMFGLGLSALAFYASYRGYTEYRELYEEESSDRGKGSYTVSATTRSGIIYRVARLLRPEEIELGDQKGPYPCLVVAGEETSARGRAYAVSRLIGSGCTYVLCVGPDAAGWHEAIIAHGDAGVTAELHPEATIEEGVAELHRVVRSDLFPRARFTLALVVRGGKGLAERVRKEVVGEG